MELEDSRASRGPSRIVIADDHPLYRSAIRQTLESHSDFEVVGEAANGREALELCCRSRPELVLMDLRMPQMDGVAATRAIKRELPRDPRPHPYRARRTVGHLRFSGGGCCRAQ
jgi:CheY-like chemotaxis protein